MPLRASTKWASSTEILNRTTFWSTETATSNWRILGCVPASAGRTTQSTTNGTEITRDRIPSIRERIGPTSAAAITPTLAEAAEAEIATVSDRRTLRAIRPFWRRSSGGGGANISAAWLIRWSERPTTSLRRSYSAPDILSCATGGASVSSSTKCSSASRRSWPTLRRKLSTRWVIRSFRFFPFSWRFSQLCERSRSSTGRQPCAFPKEQIWRRKRRIWLCAYARRRISEAEEAAPVN